MPVQDSYETADINAIHAFNVAQIEALPVTSQQVQTATRRDPTLSKVMNYVKSGWPQKVTPDLQPYFNRRLEIGIENGCLMWGIRTIIPQNLRAKTLRALHENHPGMSRMKAIARSYVWWSGFDPDIENQAKPCLSCQEQASKPAVAPLHPWVWPNSPWKRIHIDYAGPFLNKMFLVVVDAHSKWPEVIQMSSTTSQNTTEALQALFARYGLPEQIVSDNGAQFTSQEFSDFVQANGIKHIRSAPYHPSTNDQAERFVQTFKRAMKAGEREGRSLKTRLAQFLLSYRSTPHATTNVSPSELFLQRKIRTRFDLLKPSTARGKGD